MSCLAVPHSHLLQIIVLLTFFHVLETVLLLEKNIGLLNSFAKVRAKKYLFVFLHQLLVFGNLCIFLQGLSDISAGFMMSRLISTDKMILQIPIS